MEDKINVEQDDVKQKNNYLVYMHVNMVNNKKYIGITCLTTEKRWGKNGEGYLHKHPNGNFSQPAIANAILKYGWENFEHYILYENLSELEANQLEYELIEKYKTNNTEFGYNIREGGGAHGHMSEESKLKLSKSLTGKFEGEKNPFYGKHHTEEVRQFLSEKAKKESLTRDITGSNNPMYGYTKDKMTAEERYDRGKATRGKHRSEETKNKIKESNKEYYKNHEHHSKGTK